MNTHKFNRCTASCTRVPMCISPIQCWTCGLSLDSYAYIHIYIYGLVCMGHPATTPHMLAMYGGGGWVGGCHNQDMDAHCKWYRCWTNDTQSFPKPNSMSWGWKLDYARCHSQGFIIANVQGCVRRAPTWRQGGQWLQESSKGLIWWESVVCHHTHHAPKSIAYNWLHMASCRGHPRWHCQVVVSHSVPKCATDGWLTGCQNVCPCGPGDATIQ